MWFLGALLPHTPPAQLHAACAHLMQVLAFHAANGGPFLHSTELEYAARRLARAWVAAELPRRVIAPFLAHAVAAAFPPDRPCARLVRGLAALAADECREAPAYGRAPSGHPRLAQTA